MIIVDIWGGPGSQIHLARYVLAMVDALRLAKSEVEAGFLVNLRNETDWSGFVPFDRRMG